MPDTLCSFLSFSLSPFFSISSTHGALRKKPVSFLPIQKKTLIDCSEPVDWFWYFLRHEFAHMCKFDLGKYQEGITAQNSFSIAQQNALIIGYIYTMLFFFLTHFVWCSDRWSSSQPAERLPNVQCSAQCSILCTQWRCVRFLKIYQMTDENYVEIINQATYTLIDTKDQ